MSYSECGGRGSPHGSSRWREAEHSQAAGVSVAGVAGARWPTGSLVGLLALQLLFQTQQVAITAQPPPRTYARASAFQNPPNPAKPVLKIQPPLNKLLPFRVQSIF